MVMVPVYIERVGGGNGGMAGEYLNWCSSTGTGQAKTSHSLYLNSRSLSLSQSDDLLRVYPLFVNFFEMSKEALARCERVYPRFHAFLKVRGHLWGSAH